MPWDTRSTSQQQTAQSRALKAQVVDAVAPFSPFWKARLKALGRTPASVATPDGLASLPAVGERDLCTDGDPAAAAALVLQAGESGWALHAQGPVLRKALSRRLLRPGSYRAIVEADTRPTSFVTAGQALRFPLASTRSDLDVIARAGARAWSVLGLDSSDVLVSALPLRPSAALQALELAALGGGSPALLPGDELDDVAAALRLVPATVLAVLAQDGAAWVDELSEAEVPLSSLRTLLLVGAPTDAEREEAGAALQEAGVSGAKVLAVHVPDGHRLLWAECRQGGPGLHTYPDLEVVQVVDPETGERSTGAGEVVLTQLGMRGSALLRWRTGDLATSVSTVVCPGCQRTVPRVLGVQRGVLVAHLGLRGGERGVDLRAVASALEGLADVADWRVVVGESVRDGAAELVVHVQPTVGADPSEVAVAVAKDVRAAAGLLPTQVVVSGELPVGTAITRRVLQRA